MIMVRQCGMWLWFSSWTSIFDGRHDTPKTLAVDPNSTMDSHVSWWVQLWWYFWMTESP